MTFISSVSLAETCLLHLPGCWSASSQSYGIVNGGYWQTIKHNHSLMLQMSMQTYNRYRYSIMKS